MSPLSEELTGPSMSLSLINIHLAIGSFKKNVINYLVFVFFIVELVKLKVRRKSELGLA